MKRSLPLFILFIYAFLPASMLYGQDTFPELTGPWFGQKPPGEKPVIFAEGLISVPGHSALGLSISPRGNELYFSSSNRGGTSAIMFSKRTEYRWSEPEIVSFSGKYRDWDLNLSPDGNAMVFSSMRPVKAGREPKKDSDVWIVRKNSSGEWGDPVYIDAINTGLHEVHPTIASNGNIYFFSQDNKAQKAPDICISRFDNGKYTKPVPLGSEINTELGELDPYITPDENILIFHSKRPEGFGENDLYVSFRKPDGSWSKAVNMGSTVNTADREYCGRLTFDGKYLMYAKRAEGDKITSFYWVKADFLEKLKTQAK